MEIGIGDLKTFRFAPIKISGKQLASKDLASWLDLNWAFPWGFWLDFLPTSCNNFSWIQETQTILQLPEPHANKTAVAMADVGSMRLPRQTAERDNRKNLEIETEGTDRNKRHQRICWRNLAVGDGTERL